MYRVYKAEERKALLLSLSYDAKGFSKEELNRLLKANHLPTEID